MKARNDWMFACQIMRALPLVVKKAASGVRLSFSRLVHSDSRTKLPCQESLLPDWAFSLHPVKSFAALGHSEEKGAVVHPKPRCVRAMIRLQC